MAFSTTASVTQPIYFISHGAPTLFDDKDNPSHKFLEKLQEMLPAKPKGLVVISAHWEEPQITVTSSTKLIYDFYGFPAHMYKATWAATQDETLAQRVLELLRTVVPDVKYDAKRGIDHGVWSPMKISFPNGGIPVVQVSLQKNLDFEYHLKVGAALRPLADENVLIVASGGSTHNLRAFSTGRESWGPSFHRFISDCIAAPSAADRNQALLGAAKRPDFIYAHPRAEHFVPLFVAAGAATGSAKIEHFAWMAPGSGNGMAQIRFEPHEATPAS
ncbi:hypothetical protein QAD02_009398 [Eretmocerus hayati]|uniref:Uncharacterized protein n=1 Tax=Eretmocerus hayati TaxID=131215 RepID=A0ACC2N988_9HYME|nr:hypothetical protein QAD02_009398 [Eretmocerus hayati]